MTSQRRHLSRPFALGATLLAVLFVANAARAATCALDTPPAATLLLPYFEVDLTRPDGLTTLFSIDNASATAVLANVVLWTDLGIPTLDFPVYLTGYDVVTINLRDVLAGTLPQTASLGQDGTGAISPKGFYSQDINFASCAGLLPPPPLDPAAVAGLRAAHSGKPFGAANQCASLELGDNRARGYVTVDTVNRCSTTVHTPRDSGYFNGGPASRATDQNVLWGDYFLVDPANNFAEGDELVRVEATPGAFAPEDLTFYGQFVDYTAADHREPLATIWSTRFVNGGDFTGGTDLLVWRDPEVTTSLWNCVPSFTNPTPRPPAWWPLPSSNFVIFDEQEHPNVPSGCGGFLCPPTTPPHPFPSATGRTRVGGAALPVPFNFGWIYFDLGITHEPPIPKSHSQSFMTTLMSASGRYAVGFAATPLDTSCHPGSCTPNYEGSCPQGAQTAVP
jgi:hypothetical protein